MSTKHRFHLSLTSDPARAVRVLGLAIAAVCLASPALGQVDAPAGPQEPYATTHVLMRLAPGARPVADAEGRWTVRDADGNQSAVDRVLRRHGVLNVAPALRTVPQQPLLAREIGLDRYYMVVLPAGGDPVALAAALRRHVDVVEHVDLDGLGGVADVVPDDEHFGTQYALQNTGQPINGVTGTPGADIRATEAWMLATGSADVTLAILDSGVNEHVELNGRMLDGWNAVLNNEDTSDSCSSHGTHVSGSAAANAANETGIAGVDWNVAVLPVRILNGCTGLESYLANGITWAVDNGADVLNMSLQYGVGSQFLHDAVLYADASGVIMVAASGNNGFSGGVAFPGRWPETIAVAATNNRDQRATFSNTGPQLDVSAPGDDVYSLSGTVGYAYRDGTSMAAPHVSGLVTLMLSIDPLLDADQVRAILHETAVDVASAGFDNLTGWGRIDAYEALRAVEIAAADVNDDGVIDVDDLVEVILAWGPCPGGVPCVQDVDRNGIVDVDDLLAVILNWS